MDKKKTTEPSNRPDETTKPKKTTILMNINNTTKTKTKTRTTNHRDTREHQRLQGSKVGLLHIKLTRKPYQHMETHEGRIAMSTTKVGDTHRKDREKKQIP